MSPELTAGPCTVRKLPKLRALLNEVFITERNADGDLFELTPLLYNEDNLANLRIVRDGKKVVGHAGVLPRRLRWRGQTFEVGLIGGVCARQELRGAGIGTLAMQDAAGRMAELGLDFGVLWTGSHGFYERLGWRVAGGITIMGIQEAAEEPIEIGYEIMRLSESPFGPRCCHRMHEEAGRNEVIRTAEETETLLQTAGRGAWLALEGGRPAGYAAFQGEAIREIEGPAAVCIALIKYAATEGARRCVFPLNDPRIEAADRALPVNVQRRALGMLLIVNRESLVSKITAEVGATPDDLGIGPDATDEVLIARIFGQPEREPSDEPLPLDIHISHLDHV
ncbi:MAG: GNAT family N-acetyltransferase [Armatimonadota bacterium]|jgi:predicted N-acetyltransferase YhbS